MQPDKIVTPGNYVDFLHYLDTVTTEEELFSRLTYWFANRNTADDVRDRFDVVEDRAKELKLWNGLDLKLERWARANKEELARIGKDAFGALICADYAAYQEGGQAQQGNAQPLKVHSARELAEMLIPPIRYIVDELVPVGLGVLVAKPKIGKSWMILDLCLAVAAGEPFLNFPTHQHGTLYLALEDGPSRMQRRIKKLMEGRQAPENMHALFDAPRMDEGLLDVLGSYLDEHPETLDSGWEHIRINEAGLDDAGTSIETKQGDQVLAIDAEYGILLVRVTGEGYRGVLAVCRYPELLRLEMAADPGAEGELAGNIASDHGGILAMNANGFQDPNGKGNGGQLAGWCMAQGEEHGYHFGGDVYQRIELSENGLDCRIVPASDPVGEGTYNAVEFTPVLIRDGEKIEDSFWTGEQPRACFGTGDQGLYMLIIEGRYPEEGIRGTSVNTCSDILLAYGCRNALNMDGGSSAILWYDGEYVTQSSSSFLRYTGGRPLPNAWVYG